MHKILIIIGNWVANDFVIGPYQLLQQCIESTDTDVVVCYRNLECFGM